MTPDIEVRKVHISEASQELTNAWADIVNPAGLEGAKKLFKTFLYRTPPGGLYLIKADRLARDLGAEGKLSIAIAGAPPSDDKHTVLYSAALRHPGGENDHHPWLRSAIQLFSTPLSQYLDHVASGYSVQDRLMAFIAGEDNKYNGFEADELRFGIPGRFRGFHSFPGPGEISLNNPAVRWFLALASNIPNS